MEGLVRRRYEPTDAAAVAELANLLARHGGGHAGASPELVDSYYSTWVADPASDSRLVFAAGGTLVAEAHLSTPSGGGRHVGLGGGVHPEWRGYGLGRELLGWQLHRAAEIHRAAAPGVPWNAQARIPVTDEDAARLFRRFGLAPVRYWLEMAADVAAAPDGQAVPDGLRIETYTPEYEAALHAAHMEAFAEHWGFQYRELARWAPMTVRSDRFLPELSYLVLDHAEIAGFLISYRDADPQRVYIGQVGVRPGWRRRGLAGGLLAAALRAAGGAGMTRAGLLVDADSPTGAAGVYERAGFTVESQAVTYAATLPAAQE